MSPADLLLELQRLDVQAWVEDGRLVLEPDDALPAALAEQVRAREAELVGFLQEILGSGDDSGESAAAGDLPLAPAGRDRPLPLSFAQARFWFVAQMEGDQTALNTTLALRLRGALEQDALQRALDDLVVRHETLRTTVTAEDGEPVQVVHPAAPVALAAEDLAGEADPFAAAHAALQAESELGFDLEQGPLFRVRLLRLGDGDHVLLAAMHHIITDRVSWGLFCQELADAYRRHLSGQGAAPAPLRIQYADYAVWQHVTYARDEQRLLAYWTDALADLPTLELPTDRPRPPQQTFGGGKVRFALDADTVRRAKQLGAGEGATLFMTLLAAFELLLARDSGQRDLVVGTPVANRHDVDLEPILGLFVNTLVLRARLDAARSFREVLRTVRDTALGAFEHQEQPFEQLVFALRPERDMSRNPLFQVMFNLLGPAAPPRLAGLQVEALEPERVTTMLDLSLTLHGATELEGFIEYNADLFDRATVERMAARFVRLVQAALQAPDDDAWRLPLLEDAERTALMVARNATARAYPRDRTLPELLAERAARQPDALAVLCGDAALTHAELDARANQLAQHLRAQGASPGQLVGISLERSLDMIVALLAVMKSGAAYVPLDPSYPRDRVAFILEDAGAALLITREALREQLPATLPPLVRLDADADAIALAPLEAPTVQHTPDDLAYAIYTSGSTGKPKGVEIPHRALVNFLVSMADEPGLTADDVLLAVTTISFDIAGLELYLPLLQGARLRIATEETTTDGRALAATLAADATTVMQATPATWRLLLESGWQGADRLKILCGGEALPRELAEQLLPCCASLWNMYGPTEATIWSMVHRVTSGDRAVPLGAPIANTQVYVLDALDQPVGYGIPGKLYLGGDGLARGYHGRPDLTAERFRPSPFSGDPSARIYDTGDLVRTLADGTVEFLGRGDQQVKVRGFRIELEEIEHALAAHAAIQQCAVVVQGSGADVDLVAHTVFEAGASATASELRKALRATLPQYMIPAAFVTHGALPLTPNGKVDRKQLASAAAQRGGTAAQYVAPRTATEQMLATLWQEILGLAQVGIHDNFFDLGGHSLLAMRVVARVKKDVGHAFSPMELMMQSLEEFAEACDRRRPKADRGGEPQPAAAGTDKADGGGLLRRLFGRGKT